jgi:hypothetical protein
MHTPDAPLPISALRTALGNRSPGLIWSAIKEQAPCAGSKYFSGLNITENHATSAWDAHLLKAVVALRYLAPAISDKPF